MKRLFLVLICCGMTFPPVPIIKVKRVVPISQGAGALKLKAFPINISKTNYILFRFPPNIDITKWHNIVTYVSVNRTNWSVFGTNLIETQINKNIKQLYWRQEVL